MSPYLKIPKKRALEQGLRKFFGAAPFTLAKNPSPNVMLLRSFDNSAASVLQEASSFNVKYKMPPNFIFTTYHHSLNNSKASKCSPVSFIRRGVSVRENTYPELSACEVGWLVPFLADFISPVFPLGTNLLLGER